jgi:hypothetical protein
MGGYLSSRKLTNVKGRIKYITNEKKQENIIDYYNTTDDDFWRILAKENQERHKEVNAGGKCCEARELIIGIPQNFNITSRQICDNFKNKYGVECTCAIHQNNKRGIINKHCHLIFSERKKLEVPEIKEERRATRTYYYDQKGNKCKKAEAVKIVKKGTVLQKGTTRYFTDKNDFFKTQKFVYECKEMFLKDILKIDWSLSAEIRNKELSEKHIGKNNPKEKYIKQNNELKAMIKNVCNASDFVINKNSGTSLEYFKESYNIDNFSSLNYEENELKVYSFVREMQSVYKDRVKNEVKEHNYINADVNILKENSFDYNFKAMQERILDDYELQSKTKDKLRVIEFLKIKLSNMFERIKKLVSLQKDLYIPSKNRIEVYQDKRDNSLNVINESYIREKKEMEFEEPEI